MLLVITACIGYMLVNWIIVFNKGVTDVTA